MADLNSKVGDGISPTGTPYKVLLIDDSAFVIKQLQQF